MQNMQPSRIERAIEILSATRDGNDLSPKHLALVQLACNLGLNATGEQAFDDLHREVCVDKTYSATPHWFYGVEGVTKDHHGSVYWNGECIEYFAFRDAGEERAAAQRFRQVCVRLEDAGRVVDINAYMAWFAALNDPSPLPTAVVDLEEALGCYATWERSSMSLIDAYRWQTHRQECLSAHKAVTALAEGDLSVGLIVTRQCAPSAAVVLPVTSGIDRTLQTLRQRWLSEFKPGEAPRIAGIHVSPGGGSPVVITFYEGDLRSHAGTVERAVRVVRLVAKGRT